MLRLGNGCRMLRPMIPLRFRTGRHTLNLFSMMRRGTRLRKLGGSYALSGTVGLQLK